MNLSITTEEFHVNEALKLLQRTLRLNARIGYFKKNQLPLLVVRTGGTYHVRNIKMNSTYATLEELVDYLGNRRDKFSEAHPEDVILLDEIFVRSEDYLDAQGVFETEDMMVADISAFLKEKV